MAVGKALTTHMSLFAALGLVFSESGCCDKRSPAGSAVQSPGQAEETTVGARLDPVEDGGPALSAGDVGALESQATDVDEEPPTANRTVIMVVDTLRADRVGCYGYDDYPTTPEIDRLAGQGILFERFYAAAPWTVPSFGALFTGLPPSIHKAGYRLGKGARGTKRILGVNVTPMSRRVPTIGEMLGDTKSAAIVTNSFLHPAMGFARGFDHYDHKNAGITKSRRADETTSAAVKWLERHKDENFFLLVHYFDPHMGYDPPDEYLPVFAPGPSGRFSKPFLDHSSARKGRLNPTDEEKAFIIGLYNAEVRFVDDQIGELIASMDRLGMLDDTWIVVTSDHGEEHFDHGSFDHGHRYEDEVTRVPLIIRAPGGKWRAGTRIPYSSRQVDLVPTILEWMSVEVPAYMTGHSLTAMMTGEETSHRPVYMEYNLFWKQQRAIYDGRYKLIQDVIGSRRYMYDLEEDPLEQHRITGKKPMIMALENQAVAIRKGMYQLSKAFKEKSVRVKLPADVEEALRSLGYVK